MCIKNLFCTKCNLLSNHGQNICQVNILKGHSKTVVLLNLIVSSRRRCSFTGCLFVQKTNWNFLFMGGNVVITLGPLGTNRKSSGYIVHIVHTIIAVIRIVELIKIRYVDTRITILIFYHCLLCSLFCSVYVVNRQSYSSVNKFLKGFLGYCKR